VDDRVFARLRDFVEPAHPAVIRLYDDLLTIYARVKEVAQKEIDAAFNETSRQIGYVVTATLPVSLEVAEQGILKSSALGADHLKGTLFERAMMPALKKIEKLPNVSPGTYKIYILWTDALKLKLRRDWIEPAHFVLPSLFDRVQADAGRFVPPEVHEPAHWFDPGLLLSAQDAITISVIDEVYPEIRLADRVAMTRESLRRRVFPEVKEPAHFRHQDINLK
jgi:hypothetical protein